MVKFKYNMQGILELKYRLEDQAKGAFALAKQRYEAELDTLAGYRREKQEYEDALRRLMMGNLDFREIQAARVGIVAKEDAIKKQRRAVTRAEHEMEAASDKLKELMIDRKTHEALKEKAFEQYKKEAADEEMKETDELVSYRFHTQSV